MNCFTRLAVWGASCAAALALVQAAGAGPIAPGNLVVVRVGVSGGSALSSSSIDAVLQEYTTTGTLVQTITLPTTPDIAGNPRALTLSGTATSEGFLTLSGDGQYLLMAGYNAAPGTTVATVSAATVNRVIGRINLATGAVDTTTGLTDAATSGNARSAVSTNGTDLWIAGSAGGVRYTTLGSTTSTQLSTTPTNLRVVSIFNGQLYASSSSTTFLSVSTIGSGLPTTAGQTTTPLTGLPTTGTRSAYDYFFLPDGNTLYIADDGSVANGGGVQKWTNSGGTWSLQYTLSQGLATAGARGLHGFVNSGGNAVLFVTTTDAQPNSSVRTVTDLGSSSPFMSLATPVTAGANNFFRGIRVAPGGSPCGPPVITTQPAASVTSTTCAGTTSIGPVAASASPAVSYLWQQSVDGGTTWTTAAGTNLNTATMTTAATAVNGTQFRALLNNGCGTATSAIATLTSDVPATPTTATASYIVAVGTPVNMSVNVPSGVTADWSTTATCGGATTAPGAAGTTALTFTPSVEGLTTFRVAARNTTSTCVSPTCVVITVQAGYCTAGATICSAASGNTRIDRVQVNAGGGSGFSIDNDSSGSGPAGCYRNFTSSSATPVPAATIYRGKDYPVRVFNGAGVLQTDYGRVWVDWDQNLVFGAGSPEELGLAADPVNGTLEFVGTLHVPETAPLGPTRLRVKLNWSVTPQNPCGTPATYGEIEDYSVIVAIEPSGACCNGTTCSSNVLHLTCTGGGGSFQGANSTCSPNPCAQGACCRIDGSCDVDFAAPCIANGGIYQGDSVACVNVSCPAPSTCCTGSVCSTKLPANCTAGGGTVNGAGSCSPSPCVAPCCTGPVCALQPSAAACTSSGGSTFGTLGTTCTTNPCSYCNNTTPVITTPGCASGYEYISNSTFASINNSSTCVTGYEDFTAMVASVNRGQTINFSVTDTNYDSLDSINVFVDWNRNQILDDAGEVLLLDPAASGSPRLFTGTTAVPFDAATGNTRVRIRLNWNNSNIGPCATSAYGNIEDYTLNVLSEAVGACCLTDSTCQSVLLSACTGMGGAFQNPGTTCTTGLCNLRACCTTDGSVCSLKTQNNCASDGGLFRPAETACGGSACPSVGRCCSNNNATCAITYGDEAHCAGLGANFIANETCAASPCTYCGGINPGITYPCESPGFPDVEYISRVRFAAIDNAGPCGAGYENFTALTGGAGRLNESFTITVDVARWYSSTDTVTVFVDLNRNNIFDEGTEVFPLADTSSGPQGSTHLYVGPVNIPLGTALGTTRLRVRHNYGASSNPCSNTAYGNVEDYTLTILPEGTGACCNGDVCAAGTTASACSGSYQGHNSTCTAGLCNSRACCLLDGSVCVVMPEANCVTASGIFNAGSLTCTSGLCPAVGRCCSNNNATCVIAFGDAGHCANPGANFAANTTCETNPCAYCAGTTPSISIPCGSGVEYISNVTFDTINNASACSTGYENFTNLSAGVNRNQAILFTVADTNYDSGDSITVFVDFNRNNIFNDPGEKHDLVADPSGSPRLFTGTITVPNDATLGVSRVRVRLAWNDFDVLPCENATYGNVEDYAINILPEAIGACCTNGNCEFIAEANCASQSGLFQGTGVTCAQANCATGACCIPTGGCSQVTQANCTSAQGTFNAGVTCGTVNPPCPLAGSCCHATSGSCTTVLQSGCPLQSSWTSGGSCSPNPCPGQVCQNPVYLTQNISIDGNLAASTESSSIAPCSTANRGLWYAFTAPANGVYRFSVDRSSGAGFPTLALYTSDCALPWQPAPGSGPACRNTGVDATASTDQVLAAGQLVLFRAGSNGNVDLAWSVIVSPVGACCQISGACIGPVPQPACTGSFGGGDTTCTPNNCPQPTTGACCNGAGGCSLTTAAACPAAGAFQGVGSACVASVCGLCCRGATCSLAVYTSAACQASVAGATAGSKYVASTACGGINHTTPCCYANYNQDGTRNVSDIFAFLTDWFAARPWAVTGGNGTGAPMVSHIFSFLTDWFAGGC